MKQYATLTDERYDQDVVDHKGLSVTVLVDTPCTVSVSEPVPTCPGETERALPFRWDLILVDFGVILAETLIECCQTVKVGPVEGQLDSLSD